MTTFRDMMGQERALHRLRRALRHERTAHAYVFSGRPGIGKATAALALAQALNCPDRHEDGDACGRCLACRKISRGHHPDVFSLVPDGSFMKIQQIRELQDQMRFRPFEGKRRVFILDEADRLHPTAANALLKTLEEPAPGNTLILVSARRHLLPLTILSRCQDIRFSPLPREIIAAFLKAKAELSDGAADALAAAAGGSLGDALTRLREDYLPRRDNLLDHLRADRLGHPLNRLSLASHLASGRADLQQGLTILLDCFRDALVYRELRTPELLIHKDRLDVIAPLAAALSGQDILTNMALTETASLSLEQNLHRLLTLDLLAFKLRLPAATPSPAKQKETRKEAAP